MLETVGSRQALARDLLAMYPNGGSAVISFYILKRRLLHQHKIGNLPPRASFSSRGHNGEAQVSGLRSVTLLLRVADENNVGIGVPAHQRQLFSIEGPVKVVNAFRLEIGDGVALRAIQRL